MKKLVKVLSVFASIALLFAFTSCEQPTDPATTWTPVTSLDGFIGTWQLSMTEDYPIDQEGTTTVPVTSVVTLFNEGTFPLITTISMDYTNVINAQANQSGLSAAEIWAAMVDLMPVEEGLTLSSGSPYLITMEMEITEAQFFNPNAILEINSAGTQLRATSTDEDDEVIVQVFTKI